MQLKGAARKTLLALAIASAIGTAHAKDLGVEGQVYEIIEEDIRVMVMRLVARHDWTPDQQELEQSARAYTKSLPQYILPRAEKTHTRWKDVGVITTEDIYLPLADMENGSIFEPVPTLAVEKGTYLNPISQLPAAAIERLFIFDATDADQLALARALMAMKIPMLNFMVVAGDPGELSADVQQPVFHPPPTMLDKFHVRAVPTLVGFGRGRHQGHMALTEIAFPASLDIVKQAWFGLGDTGEPDATMPQPATVAPAPDPVAEPSAQGGQ